MTVPSGQPPMRLAYLGDPNSRHTRHWLAFFLDRGHQVHLLVPAHDNIADGLDRRVRVERFTAWPRVPVRGLGSLVTAVALRRLLRSLRPDVLHAHALSRYGVAGWLSGFHPYVLTVWGSDVLVVMRRSATSRLRARLALGGADLVTGGSQELIRAAIESGAHADRTQYVHFGVDTERFTPHGEASDLGRRLGLEGRRVVLSNRAIVPLYRQRVVVEALPQLAPDVVVVMTRHGGREDEIAAVLARARELGVEERVRILPQVDDRDMPDLYRLADVVVSVPASDGGPISVAEALSVGRPVVATDLPSVREWLADLEPSWLVPLDDPNAVARTIRAILGRPPAELEELAARGRAAVEGRASLRDNMLRMEGLYRQLAARHPRGRPRHRTVGLA